MYKKCFIQSVVYKIWMWRGFEFDKDLKDKEVLKYINILVDGQYIDSLRNPT